MSILLSAKDVTKTYKTASGEVHALNGVSYDFEQGVFYAIIGRSGSGKSTFLHILGGLDQPTSGQVLLQGQDVGAMPDAERAVFRRRHMGFVFQRFNLLEEYSVQNNILMPLKLDHRRPDPAFFEEVVGTLGLSDKLKKFPSELSGRPAAAGCHCPVGAGKAGADHCGRAHRQPGQKDRGGDHGAAHQLRCPLWPDPDPCDP